MSFHDLPFEVMEERVAGLRREAETYRIAHRALQARRARARRRWSLWRRATTTRLAATAKMANDIVGAIISPPWPTRDEPPHYRAWPSAGR